jgi:hypothetical protein
MERNPMTLANVSRRATLQAALTLAAAPLMATPAVAATAPNRSDTNMPLTTHWDKTFPQNSRVAHRKVTFRNRYGVTRVADLYQPNAGGAGKLPHWVSGAPGAVKEQVAGLYAQTLAERLHHRLRPSFTAAVRCATWRRRSSSPKTSARPSTASACCRSWIAIASASWPSAG